jgi:hypothetical protein
MKFFMLPVLLATLTVTNPLKAQEKTSVNFDKITLKDFSLEGVKVDTSYGAVVLADVGKSSFYANQSGYFSIEFKYQRRVKIISPKGFDIATLRIPLYKQPSTEREETLESLKASTYNIVNGKIEETKLQKENIFKEVQDKNHTVRKFTMPNIKEGSVIDISYTIHSDFLFNLQPWSFQGSYPRLWSEYNLNLPEFFRYVFLMKGTHAFHFKNVKEKFQAYVVRIASEHIMSRDDLISLSSNNTISKWIMKDVPALKEESFTSSIDNHLSRIEFQMAGQKFPEMPYVDVMGSWSKLSLELLKDKEFGSAFQEENEWLTPSLASLKPEGKTDIEKAKDIYKFVQSTISNKGIRGIYTSQTPKQTLTGKKGYVPDINLLLALMLKKAGLNAFPVLLSTRSNGIASADYPLVHQYNYVIVKLESDKKAYYLDASNSHLGFSRLPSYCYNGPGALIDIVSGLEPLYTDSVLENKTTNVILFNDKNKWKGQLTSNPGYYESVNIKEEITDKGKEWYNKKIVDSYTGEYAAENVNFKALDDNEKPLLIEYSINIERGEDNNILYFNPMIREGLKENYFKSPERIYPIEFPFKMNDLYNINIEIPEGYTVDEIPKSTRVLLNDGEGSFEYIITKSGNYISLRSQIKINKTFFSNEDYESVKGFFDFVVKKHAEQIVFKKQ